MRTEPRFYTEATERKQRSGAHFAEIDAMARTVMGRAALSPWQLRMFEARQPAEYEPAPVRTRARPMTVQDLFEVQP